MTIVRIAALLATLVSSAASGQDPVIRAQDTVARVPDTTVGPQQGVASRPIGFEREAPYHITAASGDEDYLRYLQISGLTAEYPWSLREFSQAELSKLSVARGSHPWSGRSGYTTVPSRSGFELLPVNVALFFNSAFPYGSNDGAIWAGRGLTSAVDLGFAFRLGPLSGTFNPIAFSAQNLSFDNSPSGVTDRSQFADPLFPGDIDRPRRFGNSAYSRIDLGQSSLRLAGLGLTAGISNANMGWGPMGIYPYLVGANAPGFPHAFAGTDRPLSVGIGRVHGRVIWGTLQQSEFSPVSGTSFYSSLGQTGTRRFISGIAGTFQPRGLTGLEVGGARLFQSVWPREGLPRSYFTKAFENIFKSRLKSSAGFDANADAGLGDNQLASAFARWVFPSSGFEIYGEFGREDHNFDYRDLVQEPDHSRTYGLGLRKVMRADSSHSSAIRAELINYELPTLARHRSEGAIYIHGVLRQGHTNRGQNLGSDVGVGTGAGSTVAWDRYSTSGRWTLAWARTVRQQNGTFYLDGVPNSRVNDILHALTVERTRFSTFGELTTGLTLAREFNRNFANDVWNVNSVVGLRYRFR